MAIDPLDDTPPPEEIDMLVEESLGHALPGPAAERLASLEKRIAYLTDLRTREIEQNSALGTPQSALESIDRDLAEARTQLAEFQAQHDSRN